MGSYRESLFHTFWGVTRLKSRWNILEAWQKACKYVDASELGCRKILSKKDVSMRNGIECPNPETYGGLQILSPEDYYSSSTFLVIIGLLSAFVAGEN